jgi:hypothetical protein
LQDDVLWLADGFDAPTVPRVDGVAPPSRHARGALMGVGQSTRTAR